MRIAIVDDEEQWRERVRQEVLRQNFKQEPEIDLFESGEQYIGSEKQYDISFIDIEMPGMDGFDTILKARENHPDGIYVILTTHVEMSRKGYVVNAFRYLDKTRLEEMEEAIRSAKILLQRNQRITITVIGDGPRQIALKNIIYVETEKHYVLIHLRKITAKCKNTMYEVESMLPEGWFTRCHNVYIVNLDEVKRIEERIVHLSNGETIQVSSRRRRQFTKLYLNRQCECANK